jgi:hypothetical protein
MRAPHNWPTREEWAKRRRTWYGDNPECHVSGRASAYAQQHEIDALIATLKVRRSQLGKELREAKKRCPLAFQQKGETKTQWDHRWYQLTTEEQEFQTPAWTRKEIFRALKLLAQDKIPIRPSEGGCISELAWLQQRRQSAYDAEEDRIIAEVAATPIDDEAWAKELAERAEFERVAALPDSHWFVLA